MKRGVVGQAQLARPATIQCTGSMVIVIKRADRPRSMSLPKRDHPDPPALIRYNIRGFPATEQFTPSMGQMAKVKRAAPDSWACTKAEVIAIGPRVRRSEAIRSGVRSQAGTIP